MFDTQEQNIDSSTNWIKKEDSDNHTLICEISNERLIIKVKQSSKGQLILIQNYNNINLPLKIAQVFYNIEQMFNALKSCSFTVNLSNRALIIYFNRNLLQQQLQIQMRYFHSKQKIKQIFFNFDLEIPDNTDVNQYKEVTIKYGQSCQKILQKLGQIPKISVIRIQWNDLSKKEWILKILEKLPNLSAIHLNCAENEFDSDCVKLVSKMSNLTKLFYGLEAGTQYIPSAYWYRECKSRFKSLALSQQQTINLSRKKPNLQNFWIGQDDSLNQIFNSKSANLWKHIAIGMQKVSEMKPKTWLYLKQFKQLISLTLYRIDNIDKRQLSIVIANNCGSLKSMILIRCCKVNQQGLSMLSQVKQLNQLYLFKTDTQVNSQTIETSIKGNFLHQLQKLTKLYLRYCDNVTQNTICEALNNMKNLVILTFTHMYWVNKKVMKKIGEIKTLKYLNLNCCGTIEDEGFSYIENLQQLVQLNLGLTKISNQCLINIICKLPRVSKLALTGLMIERQQLKSIGTQLKDLTHIDVQRCKKIEFQSFNIDDFPSIKYIDVYGSSIIADELRQFRSDIKVIN